jgi:RNA polymerase sigma-70 factor (ECF subfamily)
MAADSTTQLQGLIDRMAAGDRSARDELIRRAYERLCKLAHRMLRGFPRMRAFAGGSDVLQASWFRLSRALDAVPPASVADFFRLATRQMRWELLDLVKRHYGPKGPGGKEVVAGRQDDPEATALFDVPESTHDPAALTLWTEFHKAVEVLPEEERAAFELWWYQGMTQAEAAAALQVPLVTLRRRLVRAKRRLGGLVRGEQED